MYKEWVRKAEYNQIPIPKYLNIWKIGMFDSFAELSFDNKQRNKYKYKYYSRQESLFSELESLEVLAAESEEVLRLTRWGAERLLNSGWRGAKEAPSPIQLCPVEGKHSAPCAAGSVNQTHSLAVVLQLGSDAH